MSEKNVTHLKNVVGFYDGDAKPQKLYHSSVSSVVSLFNHMNVHASSQEGVFLSEEEKKYQEKKDEFDMKMVELEEEKRKLEILKSEFKKNATEFLNSVKKYNEKKSSDMAYLVKCVVEDMLQKNADLYHDYIVSVVSSASDLLHEKGGMEIHVSSSDAEFFKKTLETIGLQDVKITVNPSFSEGSVFMKSSVGSIDASVSTRLDEMLERFHEKRT